MDQPRRTKYLKSRVLREMRNNADHPFSPPSSTGSHGTVTLTSDISHFLPDGESTRQPMAPNINTSAIHRAFPGWWQKDDTTGKENKQPASPEPAHNDTSSIFGNNSPRLRMPREAPPMEVEDTLELPPLQHPRGNLTTLLDTLQTARSAKAQADQESVKRSSQISPKSQSNAGLPTTTARRSQRQSQLNIHAAMNPSLLNQTGRSFCLPQFTHIHDLLAGNLTPSKNGTSVFVKHGKVYDRGTRMSGDYHADFEDVNIPLEEEEIFVSLDKIREEIQILHDHDEHVSEQAEQLQSEVVELQAQLAKLKSRKDSAVGSESDSSMIMQLTTQKSQLAEQIAALKIRLNEANRQISANEIHNQSIIAEREQALQQASDVIKERDDALNQATHHANTANHLQKCIDGTAQENRDLHHALQKSDEEVKSLNQMCEEYKALAKDIAKDNSLLKEDNRGLVRQNEDLYTKYKLLQQGNEDLDKSNKQLKQANTELEGTVAQLQERVTELSKELSQKMDTQYAQQVQGAVPKLSREKLTKMTQRESWNRHTTMSETSAKATTSRTHRMHFSQQENDTRESDFTRESRRSSQGSIASVSVQGRSSKFGKLLQAELEDRNTLASVMSAKTTTSNTDMQMKEDYARQLDTTHEPQIDSDNENMTSALFIDDVTLDSNKRFGSKQKSKNAPTVRVLSPVQSVTEPPVQVEHTSSGKQKEKAASPILSTTSKRVLKTLDSECRNCTVCTRIRSHKHEPNEKCGKRKVRIEAPEPVREQPTNHASTSAYDYEDQPTLRPSQDPAVALAKVKKVLKDEEKHILKELTQKVQELAECDAEVGQRKWKKIDAELKHIRKRLDLKRVQIYNLRDVQVAHEKASGQWMSTEAIDMTIQSVLSLDPTWDGSVSHH
ncbi:hypothetical protein F5Y08DRAFT_311232 [Xylaria arbuscula]|nr:hypothetical protein F5Y08DRAFT_311232 [Xylaria arbuscula]